MFTGDISGYRPKQPPVRCRHCSHVKGDGTPEKVESRALHFGMPPSRYGVLLIRVQCHGEQQDIAVTFKWLVSNQGKPIDAFSNQLNDYGLRDMVERDGYSLPTNLQQCRYQLETPRALPGIAGESIAVSEPETYGKYVLARFVRRMDAELVANEHKGDWNKRRAEPVQMSRRIIKCAQELAAIIKRSESSAVSTGPITELCADLANLSMKAYELFGTPTTRPEKWIDSALPNAAAGTKYDLPMRSPEIDIKPEHLAPLMPTPESRQAMRRIATQLDKVDPAAAKAIRDAADKEWIKTPEAQAAGEVLARYHEERK